MFCPRCGSKNVLVDMDSIDDDGNADYSIVCIECNVLSVVHTTVVEDDDASP